jgi:phosphoglycolate phosphatase
MPVKLPKFKAWLFDLDGTLIDSAADLTAAANFVRADAGLPALSEAQVSQLVGEGVAVLVRRLAPGARAERYREWEKIFFDWYFEHCLDKTLACAGVYDALVELKRRGAKIGVVTNKSSDSAEKILKGLALWPQLDVFVGGDDPAGKKPDPKPLWLACRRLEVDPKEAVMVGDSHIDIEAGKRARVHTLGIMNGLGDQQALKASQPDLLADSFAKILEWILKTD